ncbi:MAG: glycerol kinase 5 [Promethearchaeota archaeon]
MQKYILSIDSGSTGIRALLFDKQGQIVAREYEKTPGIYPQPGYIEHDPEVLWQALITVVKKILTKPEFSAKQIAAIGICNQRASFTLWEKGTGKPIINFINWADVRAAETAIAMNKDKKWRRLQNVARIASKITKSPMMALASMMEFTTDHTSIRLKWVLDNMKGLRERCRSGEIMFGTLDTWFIYKLTGGKSHVTDYTNAATGLLDPFDRVWSERIFDLMDLPYEILPEVKDTNGDFGFTDPALFEGVEIPIRSAVGDQQAALFGQCCFTSGDVKISQGSGAFVDMNVGSQAKLSKRGLFPLIAWVLDGKPTYMLEGVVATAGTLIDWLGEGIGLSDTPKVLNELAVQCEDTEGVIFVPTPSGIRFPYFKPTARGSLLGLSLSTHRCHVARAVLEGIALRIFDILEGMQADTGVNIRMLKVDGGVSQSDILLQSLANFANLTVKRAPEPDMTATGAAYLAGLAINFWKDQEELKSLEKGFDVFEVKIDPQKRQDKLRRWEEALQAILSLN